MHTFYHPPMSKGLHFLPIHRYSYLYSGYGYTEVCELRCSMFEYILDWYVQTLAKFDGRSNDRLCKYMNCMLYHFCLVY